MLTLEAARNRFPIKHATDGAALLKVLLKGARTDGTPMSLAARARCLSFYFHADGVRRLQVGTPRSGTLWSELAMTLAIDLAQGGDGSYTYENDQFYPRDGLAYRRLDWRVPSGEYADTHIRKIGPALGEQLYFHSRLPYSRIRCACLKQMKTVVITRSILDIMESRFLKFAAAKHRPDVEAHDENSFDWDHYLGDVIEFCNSWGDAMQWHPNILHFRFEDLKRSPVDGHREILKFWGFDIPVECIEEGLRRASKEGMAKVIPADERETNERVSFRTADQRGVLSASIQRRILDRLGRDLVHDFGHSYTAGIEYGKYYD